MKNHQACCNLKGKILQIKEINKNEFIDTIELLKPKKNYSSNYRYWVCYGISRILSNKGKVYVNNQSFKF